MSGLRAALKPEALLETKGAYIWYAAELAPVDAREWLLRAAESWATEEWVDFRLWMVHLRPDHPRFEDVDELVIERISGKGSPEGLHDALVFLLEERPLRHLLPPIGRWLARSSGPGDAAVVAEWLQADVGLPDDVRLGLSVSLLERGFAELRRDERLPVAARVLRDVDRERPDLRELALRVFLQNEGARSTSSSARSVFDGATNLGIENATLLAIAQRALDDGADESLAVDVVSLVGWYAAAVVAFRNPQLARVAQALVGELAERADRIAGTFSVKPCLGALFESDLELPPLRSPAAIEGAISVVREVAGHPRTDRSKLHRWTRTTAESWFDLHGLCRGDVTELTLLERLTRPVIEELVEHAALHGPLREVLEARLIHAAGKEVDTARTILDAHPNEAAAVAPALRSLPARAVRLEASAASLSMSELTVELERLLLRPWPKPIAGVDFSRLISTARFIDLRDLEDEWKYEVVDGSLRVDRTSLMGVVRGTSGETALAVAGLYVVHEMIHGHQGLDDKDVVAALRATGAESTLMHVDLAADHAATAIVHDARRTWSIEWLKDLHCVNSRKFPVGPHHIQAARARKLGRVLGLRADYLIRAYEIVPRAQLGDGYAFLELGPAGGTLVVLASGPPLSVLGQTDLGGEDAKTLSRAADRDAPSQGELDTVMTRLLRHACGPSGR